MERRQAARVLNMKSESAMRRSRRFGLVLYKNRVFPSGGFRPCRRGQGRRWEKGVTRGGELPLPRKRGGNGIRRLPLFMAVQGALQNKSRVEAGFNGVLHIGGFFAVADVDDVVGYMAELVALFGERRGSHGDDDGVGGQKCSAVLIFHPNAFIGDFCGFGVEQSGHVVLFHELKDGHADAQLRVARLEVGEFHHGAVVALFGQMDGEFAADVAAADDDDFLAHLVFIAEHIEGHGSFFDARDGAASSIKVAR